MSRIGFTPITVPSGVEVKIDRNLVSVKGKLGELNRTLSTKIDVKLEDGVVNVTRHDDQPESRALHGLTRSLVNNMVVGVTQGYSKHLDITGAGWNAAVQGKKLVLNIGYANPRELEIPMGLDVEAKGMRINIKGYDKQAVGQFAAVVRSQRKPEPYKGKGIRYIDEKIIRKQGKVFASGGA